MPGPCSIRVQSASRQVLNTQRRGEVVPIVHSPMFSMALAMDLWPRPSAAQSSDHDDLCIHCLQVTCLEQTRGDFSDQPWMSSNEIPSDDMSSRTIRNRRDPPCAAIVPGLANSHRPSQPPRHPLARPPSDAPDSSSAGVHNHRYTDRARNARYSISPPGIPSCTPCHSTMREPLPWEKGFLTPGAKFFEPRTYLSTYHNNHMITLVNIS